MRTHRIIGRREINHYHIMSRVVNRDHVMGREEKEFFVRRMRKLEAFTGLSVLTYCVMGNHWHILIEVPTIRSMPDAKILERLAAFHSPARAQAIQQEYTRALKHAEQTGSEQWIEEWRRQHLARMGNLSSFVKDLKEGFSKWYNRRNNRRGTLWEERFKSVLVEDSDHTLTTMAAYIDLNPVRAGLVGDPKDYRYCGYAAAVAGDRNARRGIERVASSQRTLATWRTLAARYRRLLFGAAERKGFDPDAARQVLAAGGALSRVELARCHVRYFTDGLVLGSNAFVEEFFERHRGLFGARRKTGARAVRGGVGLYCCRDLRLNAIAPAAPG